MSHSNPKERLPWRSLWQMKWLVVLYLLLASLAQAKPNQQIPHISAKMEKQFTLSNQDFSFEGKSYRVFVAKPVQQSTAKHKVLYLLDGNAHFPLALNMQNLAKNLPLVVGIGYPSEKAYSIAERTRDYTPLAEGEAFKLGGGAADFLRFITQKVQPYIAQHYAIEPTEQHFFGHSFGGLFGLYVLFHQPDTFQHYTIASPSLWWGEGNIIPHREKWIEPSPTYLQIILGEYEAHPERDPAMNATRLAKITARQAVFPTEKLAEALQKQGVEAHFQMIKQKDHGGVIEEAMKRAVAHIQQ